ncbi:aspartyl-phosphate phosphatase Spo0E family protein [Peribacillus kribbensis]|uniref:aspartyl-phosphate phosphatase Spo0E family protein n=1 Tax=Peribacillus kribbensis TaxID=356658 RepID=UPI00040DCF1E|nr:aspartyl-phosphate phosphatase Spo0E family protein [Peribacillus kribbensis]
MKYEYMYETTNELSNQIYELRTALINTGLKEGLLSTNTLEISRQLDTCLNKYQILTNPSSYKRKRSK